MAPLLTIREAQRALHKQHKYTNNNNNGHKKHMVISPRMEEELVITKQLKKKSVLMATVSKSDEKHNCPLET